MEAHALCLNPPMRAITRAEVVEEIRGRVRDEHPLPRVDESQTVDTASGGNKIVCPDRGERARPSVQGWTQGVPAAATPLIPLRITKTAVTSPSSFVELAPMLFI
jgi:hypothetical protein